MLRVASRAQRQSGNIRACRTHVRPQGLKGACPRTAVGMAPGPERISGRAKKDSRPSEPLVPDSYLGPFCRRFLSSFIRECGKDSAEGTARKGFRAERTCPACCPVGSFGRREFLRWWLLAFGRRTLVFSFQRASAADGSGWRAGSLPVLLGGRTSGLFRKGRLERSGGELRLRLRWGLCGAGGGQGGGRSTPCFIRVTSQGSELPYLLVEDRHRDGR